MALSIQQLRDACSALRGAYEDYPFGEDVAVYKVKGKMFAYVPLSVDRPEVCLKADPVEGEMLRQRYADITPGYHMNKKHWNTVITDGQVPDKLVHELIEDSYALVVRSLKKADREALQNTEKSSG